MIPYKWIPEWVVKKMLLVKSKIPDGIIVLNSGIKIALEVETWYKQRGEWKSVVYNYSREIDYTFRGPRYNTVLIVAYSISNYEGIRGRIFYVKPEFFQKNIYVC